MIIDGLPVLPTSPATGDELPIERGTDTYKVDYNALATAIISKLGGDPVAVAHGGSGLTASPSLLVNLESTSAADVMQASPRPGVDGELPVTNGGTGADNAADALTNLGAFPSANVYNGLDKTVAGYALDARQGRQLNTYSLLLHDEIPDTVQAIAFDSTTGNVSTITHTRDNTAIRTDAFTFGTGTITEVRTLNTGENLTIVTNTATLQTTVTYAAA